MPNLSLPGNPRYQPANLVPFFGYDNIFRYVAEVEIATMDTLAEIGVIPKEDIELLTPELRQKLLSIPTTEVDEVERKITKHDIRAWVQIAQSHLPPKLRRWVHVPLTSYDALDTARALQYVRAHTNVVQPLVHKLISQLRWKTAEHMDTLQIGRTHGQHALPITVGFWLATILHRICVNAEQMDSANKNLTGKISGAVGAYNAQVGLGITTRCGDKTFEARVLEKLGLWPSVISTQISPPESLAYYLFSATMLSASIGQLGRDGRHLMRTEVGEIGEPFESGQVGSSTMAHKRNPITFENSEGMWLRTKSEFSKVFDTLISEHQRDLVGSCVARDFPIIIVNLTHQLNTLLRAKEGEKSFIEKMGVDKDACARNFSLQSKVITAEPIYIALQMAGYEGDAHHVVNHKAMKVAQKEKVSLIAAIGQIANEDEALFKAYTAIPQDILNLLGDPEQYTGLAAKKAHEVCEMAYKYIHK
jgi:adenylosuccinate lyase